MGIAKGYIVLGDNLSAQLIAPLVWGIEPQVQLTVILGDIVHQRSSVVAQSCAVSHNALCVVSYLHHLNFGANIHKNNRRTYNSTLENDGISHILLTFVPLKKYLLDEDTLFTTVY